MSWAPNSAPLRPSKTTTRRKHRLSDTANDGRISEPEETISIGSERRWPPPRVLLVLALLVSAVVAAVVIVLVAHHNTARHQADASSTTPPPTPLPSSSPPSASQAPGGYAAFCAGEPGCPGGSVPNTLRRPLRHLAITDGRCPTTPERIVSAGVAAAAGPGPVFAVTGDPHRHGTVIMTFPPDPRSAFADSQFSGQRIGWLIAPSYQGPILIRGWQLDGAQTVRFSTLDGQLLNDLQLPPTTTSAGSWRQQFAYVRIQAPGCYAWQIDGTSFSYAIAFHVTSGP